MGPELECEYSILPGREAPFSADNAIANDGLEDSQLLELEYFCDWVERRLKLFFNIQHHFLKVNIKQEFNTT